MSENVHLDQIGDTSLENGLNIGFEKVIKMANAEEVTFSVDDAVNEGGYGRFQIQLLVLAGIGWAADACEIFILSVIGNFMACDWPLHQWQIAMLTSIVFAGISIGSPIFGIAADKYGRKKALSVSVVCLFVFGAASAASPSFVWMVVLRGSLGISVGGLAQGLILTTEYCPTHMRGKAGFYLCYFWSIGTVGVILLVWVIMEYLDNWRILLGVVSLPCLVVVISLPWYPESARFYLVSQQPEQAIAILQKMVALNGRDLPPGRLMQVTSGEPRGRLRDLVGKQYLLTSILLSFVWFGTAFAYYGIALVSPLIIQKGSLLESDSVNGTQDSFNPDMDGLVPCTAFTQQNYIDLLWTSAAEFPGLIVFTILVERCSRKLLLGVSCIISAALVLLLLVRTLKIITLLILFAARGIILAVFQLIYIVTSETYPTTFRSVAMGLGSSLCRIGGLIVPYVAQVLVIESPIAAMCLIASVVFISGIAALFLPYETRGAKMKESQILD